MKIKYFSWCQLSLKRFYENKVLVFINWRSCKHCFENEWTLTAILYRVSIGSRCPEWRNLQETLESGLVLVVSVLKSCLKNVFWKLAPFYSDLATLKKTPVISNFHPLLRMRLLHIWFSNKTTINEMQMKGY